MLESYSHVHMYTSLSVVSVDEGIQGLCGTGWVGVGTHSAAQQRMRTED